MRVVKKLLKITAWIALVVAIGLAIFAVPTIWFKPWSVDHFYARFFLRSALRHPMILSQMRILEPMGFRFHNDDLNDASIEFQVEEVAQSGMAGSEIVDIDTDAGRAKIGNRLASLGEIRQQGRFGNLDDHPLRHDAGMVQCGNDHQSGCPGARRSVGGAHCRRQNGVRSLANRTGT